MKNRHLIDQTRYPEFAREGATITSITLGGIGEETVVTYSDNIQRRYIRTSSVSGEHSSGIMVETRLPERDQPIISIMLILGAGVILAGIIAIYCAPPYIQG